MKTKKRASKARKAARLIDWKQRAQDAGASVRLIAALTGVSRSAVQRYLSTDAARAWNPDAPKAAQERGFRPDMNAAAIRAAIKHVEREARARQAFAARADAARQLYTDGTARIRAADIKDGIEAARAARKRILRIEYAAALKLEHKGGTESTRKNATGTVLRDGIDPRNRTVCAFTPSFRFLAADADADAA